jgi:hypothetical protein
VTAAVVGARSAEQLTENVRAAELALEPADLAEIDAASRLTPEYPRWYQDLPLGRRPGEARGLGRSAASERGQS